MTSPENVSFTVGPVWRLCPNEHLHVRFAQISLDPADIFLGVDDFRRPLLVNGIKSGDCFVSLGVATPEESKSIGYVVTDCSIGLIVPGDLIERDPRTWLGEMTKYKLSYLGRKVLTDFGFTTLPDHLKLK